MLRTLAIILLVTLSGCGPDPFGLRDTPRTATEVAYAREVCDSAGPQSRACIDARHQMDLQCYRTLGSVDCYRSSDPFGNARKGRAVVLPIDRRTALRPPDEPPTEAETTETAETRDAEDPAASSEPEAAPASEPPAAE